MEENNETEGDISVVELFLNRNNRNEGDKSVTEDNNHPDTLLTVQEPQREEGAEGHCMQFYSKNLGLSRNGCMRIWKTGILHQHKFLVWLFIFLYKQMECIIFTIMKIILGVSATVLFSLEYKEIKYMNQYLKCFMRLIVAFMITIILQNIVLHWKTATARWTSESDFEYIAIICWCFNVIMLFVFMGLTLHKIIVNDIWTINYCFAFFFLALMIITDPFGLFILTNPLILVLVLEGLMFYMVGWARNKYCRRKRIPGIDYAPNLSLREYQRWLKEKNILHDIPCPICREELRQGQNVIFMPCGREHVFHTHCIQIWLSSHSICPTCRAEFIYLEDPQDISAPSNMPTHHLDENSDAGSDTLLESYITQFVQPTNRNLLTQRDIPRIKKKKSKSVNDLQMID